MSKNPKGLSYDREANTPSFLRRLRGEATDLDAANAASLRAANRAQRPAARSRKDGEEDDDAPMYVGEDGESVSLKEFERMRSGDGKGEGDAEGGGEGAEIEKEGETGEKVRTGKEEMAKFGLKKKRKAGKVVGEWQDDGDHHDVGGVDREAKKGEEATSHATRPSDERAAYERRGVENGRNESTAPPSKAKKRKKAKVVKLAFGDDEEE